MEQKILFRVMKTFKMFHHTLAGFRSISPETNMTYENDYKNKTGLNSMKVLSQSAQTHSPLQSHKSTNSRQWQTVVWLMEIFQYANTAP